MIACSLAGCNGAADAPAGDTTDAAQDPATDNGEDEGSDKPAGTGDTYDDYIKNAIENVNSDKAPENKNEPEASPTPFPTVDPALLPPKEPENVFGSSDDNSYDPFSGSTTDPFSKSTTDNSTGFSNSSSSGPPVTQDPTPTPYITPDEFEVGKCCIYMNGESDSAFGTEVVTAINKTRKDLGYKELVVNTSLTTCADRRTREVAALRSHQRPNGQMYFTLAPEHFKAEMIIVGTQKAEAAVDTLIKTDPASRYLVFTEKYQSVGASSFKSNGLHFTVVAFGL